MPDDKRLMRRALDRKLSEVQLEQPLQGWIKTIREAVGMTTCQLAQRMGITQPRVSEMECNENNLKISTLEKAARALNCRLVYAFVPNEPLEDMVQRQAKRKAHTILQKVNHHMKLEDQGIDTNELIEDTVQDLLTNNLSKIWSET
jgi:predicted DNA-binding mobile mystery protein A